jgi:adenylate cyclase
MERELAIFIADLSGYTALTEVHGPLSAADLIDQYIKLVKESLVGGSRLHERVGDEVLIIADSPSDLLATALLLLQMSQEENYFLQLHGGLHYGQLLERNGGFFGSALNYTARIAAKADAGSFWCSKEFIEKIPPEDRYRFQSKGTFAFKNVTEEKEVFEVLASREGFLRIDPVCRMLILSEERAVRHPGDPSLYFCSDHCLSAYISAGPKEATSIAS